MVLPDRFISSAAEASGSFRYAVTDRNGKTVLSSRWPTAPAETIRHPDPVNHIYMTEHGASHDQRFYGAIVPALVGGRPVTVQVERLSGDDRVLAETVIDEFFEHGAWVSAPFLAALLLISIVTIRGTVSTLGTLSREAAAIGPETSGRRLPEGNVPREVLPLVRAVNLALDRLDAALAQQRAFTADAAHELRTPLAVLRVHADMLGDTDAADALRRDIDQMTRIVAQLLKIAQIDGSVLEPGETTDINEIAVTVAVLLNPLAISEDKLIEVTLPEPPLVVPGNREIIFSALRNLVENALRYSPQGASVDIVVDDRDTVRVIDRGPGVPPDDRERIFKRFWRADRSSSGAGLGLAIVAKSVELHGGTITVEDTPGGGSTFVLRFPPQGGSGRRPAPIGVRSQPAPGDVKNVDR
jgi:signal transduction histidine kinase